MLWRAAQFIHEQLGSTREAVLGVKLAVKGNPSIEGEALWMAAMEKDDLAR